MLSAPSQQAPEVCVSVAALHGRAERLGRQAISLASGVVLCVWITWFSLKCMSVSGALRWELVVCASGPSPQSPLPSSRLDASSCLPGAKSPVARGHRTCRSLARELFPQHFAPLRCFVSPFSSGQPGASAAPHPPASVHLCSHAAHFGPKSAQSRWARV